MRFRVSQELRQPVGAEFALELRQRSIYLDDDAELADLSGDVRLLRTDRGLLVTVHAQAQNRGACSRCLTTVQTAIEIDFEEEFIPAIDPDTGVHITSDEAADSFVIGPDMMLDLGESLRQYALMSSPSKPLCRPDCAGLCPTCGVNLNERSCPCTPQKDERWQALTVLNSKDQEGS